MIYLASLILLAALVDARRKLKRRDEEIETLNLEIAALRATRPRRIGT